MGHTLTLVTRNRSARFGHLPPQSSSSNAGERFTACTRRGLAYRTVFLPPTVRLYTGELLGDCSRLTMGSFLLGLNETTTDVFFVVHRVGIKGKLRPGLLASGGNFFCV